MLSFLILASCLGLIQEGSSKDDDGVRTDIASIARCRYQNCAAVRNADLLIEVDEVFDNANELPNGEMRGVLIRDQSTIRCVFDIDEESYCQFAQSESSQFDFSSKLEPNEPASTRSGAFCVNGATKEVFVRFGSRRLASTRDSYPESDREFLSQLGYQDVRGLLLGTLLGCSRTPEKKLDSATLPSAEELPSNILSAAKSGDEVSVTNLYKDCGVEGFGLKVTTRYSLDSLMPLSESKSLFHHASKKTQRIETARFSWKEADGVMLPKVVTVEKRLNLEVNGRRESGWKTRTYKLTWNLVNSDEQDQRFYDGSLLESSELIQKQLEKQKSTSKDSQADN